MKHIKHPFLKHFFRNSLIGALSCLLLFPSSALAASAAQKGATALGGLAAILAVLHERNVHYYR